MISRRLASGFIIKNERTSCELWRLFKKNSVLRRLQESKGLCNKVQGLMQDVGYLQQGRSPWSPVVIS